MVTKKDTKKTEVPVEVDTAVSKHLAKSEELIKMIEELRFNKQLYFDVYDGLKGFDLIMSIIGKEKIIEIFSLFMKSLDTKTKNYSHFIDHIGIHFGSKFIGELRDAYNGILKKYDTIKFSPEPYYFGTEEIYLKETLNKIKSLLESQGQLNSKNSFIKINLNFLNSKNDSLDFNFNDGALEKILFYDRLEEIDDDSTGANLLPFFHFLNNLMVELKEMQVRVTTMSEEFLVEVRQDIDILSAEYKKIEDESVALAKEAVTNIMKEKKLLTLEALTEKVEFSLGDIKRNKDIPQSIIQKDIDSLENCIDTLQNTL